MCVNVFPTVAGVVNTVLSTRPQSGSSLADSCPQTCFAWPTQKIFFEEKAESFANT